MEWFAIKVPILKDLETHVPILFLKAIMQVMVTVVSINLMKLQEELQINYGTGNIPDKFKMLYLY